MIIVPLVLLWLGLPQVAAPQPGTESKISTLREKLAAEPSSVLLKRLLGELLFHADPNNAEAGELLEQAVAGLPRDPEAKHFYAQWAYFNNREQICADQEHEAISLPKVNDQALLQMYTLQGFCNSRLGNTNLAEAAFASAFRIDNRQESFDPAIAYRYLEFLSKNGRNDEAQRVTKIILDRSPQFGPAHLELAKYYQHTKQPKKAVAEAQLTIRGEGNDPEISRAAHMILAKGYFALGDAEKTKEEQDWIKSQIAVPPK